MPDSPDRVLPLLGASNFRDLGGYRGLGGRPTRWRRLFRSDHLAGLTQGDWQALQTIGLARAVDFRGEFERAATPYLLPGVTQLALPIEPTVMLQLQAVAASGRRLDAAAMSALMTELYRSFVNDQAHRFAALFEHLLQDDGPLVFHCTAGKDRTGIAAALILLALGVPRDVVLQDYLLTNEVLRQVPLPMPGVSDAALAVLWQVQRGFLDAALQVIDADHGGVDPYLARRLGLSAAALRQLADQFLAPA